MVRNHYGLDRGSTQIWEMGVKEVWRVPRPLSKVIHTLGWPLSLRTSRREYGGSFIYPMGHDLVAIGSETHRRRGQPQSAEARAAFGMRPGEERDLSTWRRSDAQQTGVRLAEPVAARGNGTVQACNGNTQNRLFGHRSG